jgi:hypothetical protein
MITTMTIMTMRAIDILDLPLDLGLLYFDLASTATACKTAQKRAKDVQAKEFISRGGSGQRMRTKGLRSVSFPLGWFIWPDGTGHIGMKSIRLLDRNCTYTPGRAAQESQSGTCGFFTFQIAQLGIKILTLDQPAGILRCLPEPGCPRPAKVVRVCRDKTWAPDRDASHYTENVQGARPATGSGTRGMACHRSQRTGAEVLECQGEIYPSGMAAWGLGGGKHFPNKAHLASPSSPPPGGSVSGLKRSPVTVHRPRVSFWLVKADNLFWLYFIYLFIMSEGTQYSGGFVNGRCYTRKAVMDGPPLYYNGDFHFQGASYKHHPPLPTPDI